MSIWKWYGSELKILGISVFRIKIREGRRIWRILGIPVWKDRTAFSDILRRFRACSSFDTGKFDSEIATIVEMPDTDSLPPDPRNLAYLATEIYEFGGHSNWIRDQILLLAGKFRQTLFLTRYTASCLGAPEKIKSIRQGAAVEGIDPDWIHVESAVRKLFLRIMSGRPKVIFVYIHPDDVFGAAVLSLIARDGRCRIIFGDHASHFPTLGISFSDLVLDALPTSASLVWYRRGVRKTYINPSLMLSSIDAGSVSLSPEERAVLREKMGIGRGGLCTMSGAWAYKFFDETGSEYFQMIRRLLERGTDRRHVILSDFSQKQFDTIKEIFQDSEAFSRIIFLPMSRDYKKIFCCADVFIDSFPVSSALTFVELMALKVAGVVKINRENAHLSFHEYQRPDFEYMFESADEMIQGVEKLLTDPKEREVLVQKNFEFYRKTYSHEAAEKAYLHIIDHADDLSAVITPPPPIESYRFKDI